jgi:hypothetical protein
VFPLELSLSEDKNLDAMLPSQGSKSRADLRLVQEKNKAGVTAQHSKAQDKHWERCDIFCIENGIDPFLLAWFEPIPILKIFGQRYRDGKITPEESVSNLAQRKTQCGPWGSRSPDSGPMMSRRTSSVKSISA